MTRQLTIDLPQLPSFDVSNASSSISDQFSYGDRSNVIPRQRHPAKSDPFAMEFQRSELQNVIHIITAEMKSKGVKTPFVFLPFRQEDEEYKLKQFLTRIFNEGQFIEEKLLLSVVKRTDEYTLMSALKFFWSRLPGSAVIGWKSYNKFVKMEKEKGYPKKAFLTIMPYCLSSAAHASIVYDFLDLLVSVASYTKENKLSGRKICKMCGIWAFNGSPKKRSSKEFPSFARGVNDWVPASDALFHVMMSFLRSILPDDEKNQKKLPKTLQTMISANAYPPPPTKHSDPSTLLEAPIITISSNSPSRNPLELITKISKTLNFDNAKLFYSRDDYILLKNIFKGDTRLVNRLSLENRKILDKVCSNDDQFTVLNEPIKYKLEPGWSDELATFYNQDPVPHSEHFYTADISKALIDDYFIWTWLSTIGPEETDLKRNIFGKTFILEVELTENYKKWIIIEELELTNNIDDEEETESDKELDLKLQKLRKQELALLEKKLKKNSKQDLPPVPAEKELPIPKELPPIAAKPKKSKKISGKLVNSIRKFSNGEHRKPKIDEMKPLPVIKDTTVSIPRERSMQDFKLPEFADDVDDDLADDFQQYLQQSSYSVTRPLNVRHKQPSPERDHPTDQQIMSEVTHLVENVRLDNSEPQYQNSAQYQISEQQQSQHRPPMVSIYGLEQLEQYSPYINYGDGQFPSLSPQMSTFPLHENEEDVPRSPEPQHHSPQHGSPQRQMQSKFDEVGELNIPSNQTSGDSSRARRKPPPGIVGAPQLQLERPISQYSDNPITPSSSNQVLRPISQYSDHSYTNSFAPPTPKQHQKTNSPTHDMPYHNDSRIPNSASYNRMSPSPVRNLVSSRSPETDLKNNVGQTSPYQYRSMLSPVEPKFPEDKPLPPSPTSSGNLKTPQLPPPALNLVGPISPVRSHVSSPEMSDGDAIAMYGGGLVVSGSPPKSISMDPPSPTKDSLYGGSITPSKDSLYGDSKVDLSEPEKRDSTYYSLADEVLEKPSATTLPVSRASAIIDDFDLLENELQDFLNDDGEEEPLSDNQVVSDDLSPQPSAGLQIVGLQSVPQALEPDQLARLTPSPPRILVQQVKTEQKQMRIRTPPPNQNYQREASPEPNPHQQHVHRQPVPQMVSQQDGDYGNSTVQPASTRQPEPQVAYQRSPQVQQNPISHQQSPRNRSYSPDRRNLAPGPLAARGYSPNHSDQSLISQNSSHVSASTERSSPQMYVSQRPNDKQQYQQGPLTPLNGAHPRHNQQTQGYSSPGSLERLQVPQNGHQHTLPVNVAAAQMTKLPSNPSNLGPNYQGPPMPPQQYHRGPPPSLNGYSSSPPRHQDRRHNQGAGGYSPHHPSQQQYPMQQLPPQQYPPQSYPPQQHPQQQYPPQQYPPQQYPPQQYSPQQYPPQQYQPQQYPPQQYPPQQYPQQPYRSPRQAQPPHQKQYPRSPNNRSPGSFSPSHVNGYAPGPYKAEQPMMPPQQTRSDYTIQHMPPAQKVNRLHGHTDNKNTKKNLRDAIATGGFGI